MISQTSFKTFTVKNVFNHKKNTKIIIRNEKSIKLKIYSDIFLRRLNSSMICFEYFLTSLVFFDVKYEKKIIKMDRDLYFLK